MAGGSVSDFLEHPDILEFFEYWRHKRVNRDVPSRHDIDPTEIGKFLSRVFLIDFELPAVFRYRLAGDEIARVFGRGNLKGLTLDDIIAPERVAAVVKRWLPVVEQRAVLCMKGQIYHSTDRIAMGERILMPLADCDDGPATGLIGMTACEWMDNPDSSERRHSDMALFPAAAVAGVKSPLSA